MNRNVLPIQQDWQAQFQQSAFRLGFRLILTNPMLEMLCACADGVMWNRNFFGNILVPDNWIATEHALVSRGLIRRLTGDELSKQPKIDAPRVLSVCCLTPAGKAMVELLRIGGLFIEATEAKRRMAERKGRN